MSTKWWSCGCQAANRSSKVAKSRGSPVRGPSCRPVRGSRAVVQRELQDLGQVEVAGEDVRLLAEGAGLHAAAGPALARVLDALALAQQLRHDAVRVEQRREPVALADDPARSRAGSAPGVLPRDLHVGAGLDEVHLVDDLEEQVRHLAHAVRAVAPHAAEVDVGEIRVGPALGGRDADLGRRRVVVELDEQAAEQLLGPLAGQRAVARSRAGRTARGAGRGGPASRSPSR